MLFVHALSIELALRYILTIFILSAFIFSVEAQIHLNYLRANIAKVKTDESFAYKIVEQLSTSNLSVEQKGYLCLFESMLAEHAFSPLKKLSYFNSGKDRLESLIKVNSANIELRYIRLMLQLKTPSFLGYNEAIDDDRSFVLNNLRSNKDKLGGEQVQRIGLFLKREAKLTSTQLQLLEEILSGK